MKVIITGKQCENIFIAIVSYLLTPNVSVSVQKQLSYGGNMANKHVFVHRVIHMVDSCFDTPCVFDAVPEPIFKHFMKV